ncbi:GNAT family N-acetyltransferase [Paractinoplanes atraurantiacus]|uniref:Ribosomal protein S18 acetylase RimI n=1 Tax=Paractinoplanes atraurantiacus TaxID=1036182 RepID=A0A285H069_9ACTN|nr:GNAT family N-acetyltransferase [Actinoplanes atraurantiacus]SNY28176.1 Ribosomal protein S18 acetylase RimI [Actinoplanes atraurantiacus]
MSLSLRTAEEFDLYAVGALHQRSRVAAYAHILPAEVLEARSEEGFREWWAERWKWERDTHEMTVAVLDGEIVGFTYVGPSETPSSAELYAIHVAPSAVGTGVGRALMRNALDQLRRLGAPRAVLWVLEDNAVARRFYERGGWTPDGADRTEPINGVPVRQLRYALPL